MRRELASVVGDVAVSRLVLVEASKYSPVVVRHAANDRTRVFGVEVFFFHFHFLFFFCEFLIFFLFVSCRKKVEVEA